MQSALMHALVNCIKSPLLHFAVGWLPIASRENALESVQAEIEREERRLESFEL